MDLSAVEPLRDTHSLDDFSCGTLALDDWLKSYVKANQRNNFTRVMVVHDDDQVVGYTGLRQARSTPPPQLAAFERDVHRIPYLAC